MPISITLQKKVTVTSTSLFRLQVWVSETQDATMIPDIFVMRELPYIPGVATVMPMFAKVAALTDILNYAITTPQDSTGYFRQSYIDLTFKSLSDAETLWNTIKTDTQVLLDDLSAFSAVSPPPPVSDAIVYDLTGDFEV